MDLFKINLFQNSTMKQAKYLVSQPNKAQQCIYISEAGTVSMEVLPVNTGFVQAPENIKKAWVVINPLIRRVLKNGEIWKDATALPISDHDYQPLDPHNTISEKDRKKMISLGHLAKMNHAKYRHDTGKPQDPNARLTEMIVTWGFILLPVFAVLAIIKDKIGG